MIGDPELAWAAALLEGEGSVFIRESGKSKTLTPILVVNNTNSAYMERFHRAMGGLGSIRTWEKKGNLGKKPSIRWVASFRQAEAAIQMLLPYMTPNTARHKKMLKGLELMQSRPRGKYNNIASVVGPELGRPSNFPTMTDLWHNTVQSMLFGTVENRGIDYVASIDCIRYGSLLRSDSMAFEFDLGRDLWLLRSRWTRLTRQYLDVSEVTRFLERSADLGLGEGKRGAITNMRCANVLREAKKHRWGPCVLGFSFRGLRGRGGALKPTLTMYSRVSYVAYIGGADLALAHVIAQAVAKRIKIPVEDIAFEWNISSLQLHAFKSLPMLYSDGWIPYFEQPLMRERYPSLKIIGRWHDSIVKSTEADQPLTDIKYGPLRRVTRRYREYTNDQFMPSVPIESLSLEALYR